MKTPLLFSLALAVVVPAYAEVFRPGLARGGRGPSTEIVVSYRDGRGHGHGYGHRRSGWHGHSGVHARARFSDASLFPYYSRPYYGYYNPVWQPYAPVYVQPAVPVVYSSGYGYDSGYTYSRPSRAASGLWLGALAGAIIGNNSGSLGHDAWRGALYGAGAGLVIGAVADNNARQREAAAERAASVQREIAANSAAVSPQQQQPVTIINNYYNSGPATPMSSANGLFGRN